MKERDYWLINMNVNNIGFFLQVFYKEIIGLLDLKNTHNVFP